METFPVIDSILSTKALSNLVKEKYGFSEQITCKILRTGINHTYLISDDANKYVFRVYSYNWRTESEILEELKFINLLNKNNVSVSIPLLDQSDAYLQKIKAPEGLRYGVLFSFAEGEKKRGVTTQDSYNIGLLMAKIHSVSQGYSVRRIDYHTETLTQLPYQYASEYFEASFEQMIFVKKAGAQIASQFQQANTNKLRKGVVHLDIWYDNMNIDKDSKITLFDFDFLGNGWLLLDIAYTTMQLYLTEPDEKIAESKIASFYKGYESICQICEEEKQLIPMSGLAIWIFYLGVQARRFDNWSNIFFTKNYLKNFMGMAKKWLTYHKINFEEWGKV